MSRHLKWIHTCLKLATKSKNKTYKHCSLLVKGGRIISIGINKSKAGCLGHKCYGLKGWHSELDALIHINPEKIKGAELYVSGINKNGKVILSKPCKYCQEYLKQFDLKAIYYSLPDSKYGKMKIS